jgi:hypothetical protein
LKIIQKQSKKIKLGEEDGEETPKQQKISSENSLDRESDEDHKLHELLQLP